MAGGLGVLLTVMFVPEVGSLDLAEADMRWKALLDGASSHL